jgi:hypothetical protein
MRALWIFVERPNTAENWVSLDELMQSMVTNGTPHEEQLQLWAVFEDALSSPQKEEG